jgi:hypothetical protein
MEVQESRVREVFHGKDTNFPEGTLTHVLTREYMTGHGLGT